MWDRMASPRSASVESHLADRDGGVPPIGQRSVGTSVTRLRESGPGLLDVLTGEGRAVHGAASVSQHESSASRGSGEVLSGLWLGGESRDPPTKLQ